MKKLFIIVFLLLTFQSIFSQEVSKEIEQTIWKYINCKFVFSNNVNKFKYTCTFPRDIAIKLSGKVNREDSICVNELIIQMKTIIPGRKIYLTPGAVCLVFNLTKETQTYMPVRFGGDMYFRIMYVNIPKDCSNDSRKKVLYFNLCRSLVFFDEPERDCIPLKGCVFSESNPENITYSPYDTCIIRKLYANNFWEQYNNEITKKADSQAYFFNKYENQLKNIYSYLGFIGAFALLTFLLVKGTFRMRKRSLGEYNRIGLILILIGFFAAYSTNFRSFWYMKSQMIYLISYFIRCFVGINLIYLLESYLYRRALSEGGRLFLIFLISLFVPFLVGIPDIDKMNFNLRHLGLAPLFFTGAFLRMLYIFLNDRYSSMINNKDVQLAKINELHKQVQLQSLQAKINPHFLYNALNSIASLATTDAKKTEQMALSLSDFFKYSINREQKQLNSLSEELNAIRTYLEIEKVRFGERLNYEIDCPAELLNIQIPQLLVQPLVENAIKHGLSQITGKGLVKISVSKVGKEIKIRVDDNGPAFPDGPLTGYGIKNTNERIRLMYGKKASINWYNGEEKCIELSFPLS